MCIRQILFIQFLGRKVNKYVTKFRKFYNKVRIRVICEFSL